MLKSVEKLVKFKKIDENINLKTKALFNDHKSFANIYALIKYQGEECLLMGKIIEIADTIS